MHHQCFEQIPARRLLRISGRLACERRRISGCRDSLRRKITNFSEAREATTGNASAVRRLAEDWHYYFQFPFARAAQIKMAGHFSGKQVQ